MRNLRYISLSVLFTLAFHNTQQLFAQDPCDNDQWAPVIVYPPQDIVATIDPCDQNPANIVFVVTVTDDCDGDHFPAITGNPVIPGSEFTITVLPASSDVTINHLGNNLFSAFFPSGIYQILIMAEDAAGNVREEDFFVIVNQDVCNASSCLPEGITFFTQAQVDAFSANYPGCTQIMGSVSIDNGGAGIISNLNGLAQITSVAGDFFINNSALTDLSGLEALTSVGGYLEIGNNNALMSLDGLNMLTSVGHLWIYFNDALTSLDGLNVLSSIEGNLIISSNSTLTNLIGLNSITSIGNQLVIDNNDALTSLEGLNALTSVEGPSIHINNNDALINLDGLNALTSLNGFLYLDGNNSLISLMGLNGLASISGLHVSNNPVLSTCEIQAICEYLAIPSHTAFISGNATGCAERDQIEAACGPACLPLSITISGNNCFSGPTTRLTATSGSGYTYLWNTYETRRSINVPPGTYCVTVTDLATACTGTACITVCKKPTVAISPVNTTTICSGECITLKAMAGSYSTYQWSNSGPASATWEVCPSSGSTNYTVTVTNDSGCTATKSITIRTNPCNNNSGCTEPWNRAVPSDITRPFEAAPRDATEELDITGMVSAAQSRDNSSVRVYPNPASHELILDYSKQVDKIEFLALYNLTGLKIRDVEVFSTGFTRLDVSMLPPGLYILNINGTKALRVALTR